MKRKVVIIATLVIIAASFIGWLTLRVPYHQWRWAACRKTAERLSVGQETMGDEFLSLLRGGPKPYNDYYAAATRHEDVLIQVNYLARKEFRLRNPVNSGKAMDRFTELAFKRFPNGREWSCVFSATGDSVVITTVPKRMAEWAEFIREYDVVKKSKAHRKCKGRRNWLEALQPVRF